MRRRHSTRQPCALDLLASIPNGATDALLLAHRFSHRGLAGLVLGGLATVASETTVAGRTEAGR
jgi:hypothetical protein